MKFGITGKELLFENCLHLNFFNNKEETHDRRLFSFCTLSVSTEKVARNFLLTTKNLIANIIVESIASVEK